MICPSDAIEGIFRHVDEQSDNVAIWMRQDVPQLLDIPIQGPQSCWPECFANDSDLFDAEVKGNFLQSSQHYSSVW